MTSTSGRASMAPVLPWPAKRATRLRSAAQVDQIDRNQGQVTIISALAMCSVDVLSLTQDAYDFANEQLKFKVLAVRLVTLHDLAVASPGGLNAPSGAWLELDIELIAVSIAAPDVLTPNL